MKVNGEEVVCHGRSLAEIVQELGYANKSVAIAINDNVIIKDDWLATIPDDGDEVLIFEGCEGG